MPLYSISFFYDDHTRHDTFRSHCNMVQYNTVLRHDVNKVTDISAFEISKDTAYPPHGQVMSCLFCIHDDVIKWKHFPCYWPFVRGIHRSPVNSSHKGQWGGALMFSLICARINDWVNNGEVGDLRRNRAHYDVIVMFWRKLTVITPR